MDNENAKLGERRGWNELTDMVKILSGSETVLVLLPARRSQTCSAKPEDLPRNGDTKGE